MRIWLGRAILLVGSACASAPASGVKPSDGDPSDAGGDASVAADVTPIDASVPDAAAPDASRELPIPPREQWPNGGGYCGETSIQSIALFYGAWISQAVVRKVAGGEVLLGDNEVKALDALHLAHVVWNTGTPKPQFEPFAAWLKGQLEQGVPCIFAVYLTDGTNDPDYDHIMPATGIQIASLGAYDPKDVLIFNDNFGARLSRPFGTFSATRKTCASSSAEGGCIPAETDYGVAVTGFLDKKNVTLPVTMTVTSTTEPNVSKGAKATTLTATVTARGLQAGKTYALLRYDDPKAVPTDATAPEFLSSAYDHRTDFTASQPTWTLVDPDSIASDGASFYRVVERP